MKVLTKALPLFLILFFSSSIVFAQFSYNGSAWYNNSGQRFGFGTDSPQELVHINGNIRGGQSGALRISTGYGYIDIGPKNASWAHFYTDRLKYYFDKEIRVNSGLISSFDEDLQLRTSGITRMTIKNSTGQVGIGTSSPVSWAKLDIHSSSSTNGEAYIRLIGTGSGGNYSGINFSSNESVDKQWEIIHRQASPAKNALVFAHNNGTSWVQAPLVIQSSGFIGVGKDTPTSILDVNGTTTTKILQITGGSDLAESFQVHPTTNHQPLPGMVVSINPEKPGELMLANTAYDNKVAGVISGANGINTGLLLNQEGSIADGEFPVSLTGRVYCYVDASEHEIKAGDFLTTSDLPGFAMKATDLQKAQGAIIGKAMTPLKKGAKDLVLVLISLQ